MLFGCRHHPAVSSSYTAAGLVEGPCAGRASRAPDEDGGSGDPPVTATPSPLNNRAEKTPHHLAAVLPQGTAALALSTAPSKHGSPSPGGLWAQGYLWWAGGAVAPGAGSGERGHHQAEPPLPCPSAAGGDEKAVGQPAVAAPEPLSEVILN